MSLFCFEAILQGNGTVEDQRLGRRILIHTEIAQTQELVLGGCNSITEHFFQFTVLEHFEGIVIHAVEEVLVATVGVSVEEEVVVQANLCVHSGVGVCPMDGSALDLATVGGIAATGLGVIGSENLDDVAVFVLDATGATDEVCALQAALGAVWEQALVFGNGDFQEVLRLDEGMLRESDGASASLGVAGVVLDLKNLGLTFWIVWHGLRSR